MTDTREIAEVVAGKDMPIKAIAPWPLFDGVTT
jgi:hypothetical protein